ncbi:MAG: hypothetical protein AAGI17_10925 [Planctomycetota bacterium]
MLLSASAADAQVVGASQALLFAGGDLRVRQNANITGGIGASSVRLDQNARVYGDISYLNEYRLGRNSQLVGAADRVAAFDPIAMPPIPSDQGPDLRISNNQNVHLVANTFGALQVQNNVTLSLSEGVYVFESIIGRNNLAIVADTTAGDVSIVVSEDLLGGNQFTISSIGENSVQLTVLGRLETGNNARLTANIVAGSADIGQNARLVGSVATQRDLAIGANFNGTFVAPPEPSVNLPAPATAAAFAGFGLAASRRRRG